MENWNLILATDSYKLSHAEQYPLGTTEIYSYLESRGGKYREVVFYGLQYIIKKYLIGQQVTKEKIDKAEPIVRAHLGGGIDMGQWRKRWEWILEEHDGYLPVEIYAVPEGTPVPYRNVLMTIKNTDPECFWLTNYLETLLSQIWYPCTVATQSREIKKVIKDYLTVTGCKDTPNEVLFKCHDFGYRGSTSQESSAIGGSAHLINFMGTDTMSALSLISDYYNSDIVGFSIPASEHSTITSWGKDNENKAMKNMLDQYPTGLVACVSDSYDIYNACWEIWGTELREQILGRDGVLVVRPDSGNPPDVVLKVINILGDRFGFTWNDYGYKVLDPHIRIIQGDGVNYESIKEILQVLKDNKWAAENVGFGSGGALLQKMDRDTQKFAFKCSSATVNGEEIEVFKNPVTDPGKISKKGKLALSYNLSTKEYDTVEIKEFSETTFPITIAGKRVLDKLELVYKDGKLYRDMTFTDIKYNAAV